jgi:hypothetical protein
MSRLHIGPYASQTERLPRSGRHILAQFDDDAIVVYQAFQPAIGHWAAERVPQPPDVAGEPCRFGGEFSFARMSWIKTMMYRSGWATKPGQEVVLAVWLRRVGFKTILSTFDPAYYGDEATWSAAVARSTVRLQWDPDQRRTGGAGCPRAALHCGRGQQDPLRGAGRAARRLAAQVYDGR